MPLKENSHSTNLTNLNKLITIIISFGLKYAPKMFSITIAELQKLPEIVKAALINYDQTEVAYHKAIAIRSASYQAINLLITKAICSLRASETSNEVKENAKALVRKFRGSSLNRKTKAAQPTTQTTPATAVVVTSTPELNVQRGFDDQLKNINQFILLLKSITEYNPAEADITTASLTAMYNDLMTKNDAVIAATVAFNTAKIQQYNICDKPNTGMVDIALAVKDYIKSVYGASSKEYREVSSLMFKRFK